MLYGSTFTMVWYVLEILFFPLGTTISDRSIVHNRIRLKLESRCERTPDFIDKGPVSLLHVITTLHQSSDHFKRKIPL